MDARPAASQVTLVEWIGIHDANTAEQQRREREAQVRRPNSLAEREQPKAERAAKGE